MRVLIQIHCWLHSLCPFDTRINKQTTNEVQSKWPYQLKMLRHIHECGTLLIWFVGNICFTTLVVLLRWVCSFLSVILWHVFAFHLIGSFRKFYLDMHILMNNLTCHLDLCLTFTEQFSVCCFLECRTEICASIVFLILICWAYQEFEPFSSDVVTNACLTGKNMCTDFEWATWWPSERSNIHPPCPCLCGKWTRHALMLPICMYIFY